MNSVCPTLYLSNRGPSVAKPANVLNAEGRSAAFNVANANDFKRLSCTEVELLERLYYGGDIKISSMTEDESNALFNLSMPWLEASSGAAAFPEEFPSWENDESYVEIFKDRAIITFYGVNWRHG
jgi:hypothetical protein